MSLTEHQRATYTNPCLEIRRYFDKAVCAGGEERGSGAPHFIGFSRSNALAHALKRNSHAVERRILGRSKIHVAGVAIKYDAGSSGHQLNFYEASFVGRCLAQTKD